MEYNTKQREILLNFFQNKTDISFSVEEIINALKDVNISVSAIYRNLAQFEKEGIIKKISKSGSRKSFYHLVDCDDCKDNLHITCTKCGRISHLKSDVSKMIIQNVFLYSNFNIDKNNTILYGICEKCCKKDGEQFC